MKLLAAVLAVALCAAVSAETPPEVTGYTPTAGKEATGQSAKFKLWGGGANNTATDCANRCESIEGCVGFVYQVLETSTTAVIEIGKCTAYVGNDTVTTTGLPTSNGEAGMAYYERTAGPVSTPAAYKSFVGESTLSVYQGYVVWDKVSCDKETGGGKNSFSIGRRNKDLTGEECAKMCNAWMGCVGFSHSYAGKYPGYCTGYKKAPEEEHDHDHDHEHEEEEGFHLGCDLQVGKEGTALYMRTAGAVTVQGCAPEGTDNTGFKVCSGGEDSGGDFSGSPAASTLSPAAALLAAIAAMSAFAY